MPDREHALTPCASCKDGTIRVADGWTICDDCHGTTFKLPLFPSPELFAKAKAAHGEAVQAAIAAKAAARRDAARNRRRDAVPFAIAAAMALLGVVTFTTAAKLAHDAWAMRGQPVEVLAERTAR